MFDISWSEMMIVAVVAIIVVGPKDLPAALRALGRWSGKLRRMAKEFRGQFDEALREAELDGLKKDVESIGKLDPMADLRKDLSKTGSEIRSSLNKKADPELKQLAADKGIEEPAPVAEPAKTAAEAESPPAAATPEPVESAADVEPDAKPVAATAEPAPVADAKL